MSSYSEHCCTKPAIDNTYTPKGALVNVLPDLPVYVIGPENATKAIVVMYDIFGLM